MKLVKALALVVMLSGAAPFAATAHEYAAGSLTIDHPWSRATPPMVNVASGYLTVTNTGTEPDRLVGGSSPIAERIELHESTIADGVSRMRPLPDGIALEPGSEAALQPGGLHIMFVNPVEPLRAGERFPATLTFEAGGDVEVEFTIESVGAIDSSHEDHQPDVEQ